LAARAAVVVACREAVWAALMGERGADGLRDEIAAVKVHRAGQDAEEWEENYGSDDLDQPVWFRGASRSVLYRAVEYFSGSSASVVWALFPGLRRLLLWLMPQYRAYKLVKDREIGKAVTEARKRVEKSKGEDGPAATKDNDTCAVDFVLRNELIPQAKSEKSASKLNDRTLRDEFSMFLISVSLPNLSHHHPPRYATPSYSRCKIPQDRHSTNTTTGSPNNRRPPVDSQAAHQQPTSTIPSARLPPRPSIPPTSNPSAEDILTASIPYLDATLEEILRLANPVPLLSRTAVVDTTILGFPIPKGTQVLCSTDFKRDPVVEVAEEKRSESSRAAGQGLVAKDLDQFMPERWIKVDTDGKRTFDPAALPRLSFGVEERRCPGKSHASQRNRCDKSTHDTQSPNADESVQKSETNMGLSWCCRQGARHAAASYFLGPLGVELSSGHNSGCLELAADGRWDLAAAAAVFCSAGEDMRGGHQGTTCHNDLNIRAYVPELLVNPVSISQVVNLYPKASHTSHDLRVLQFSPLPSNLPRRHRPSTHNPHRRHQRRGTKPRQNLDLGPIPFRKRHPNQPHPFRIQLIHRPQRLRNLLRLLRRDHPRQALPEVVAHHRRTNRQRHRPAQHPNLRQRAHHHPCFVFRNKELPQRQRRGQRHPEAETHDRLGGVLER
jgi:hypothetical protein